ncbi:MAG: MFS transporter [Microcoleaceae cyanobacterium]
MGSPINRLLSWLPQLNPQVWILALGRLLSQIGSGFTLFYAPIFFVNQVGLSATAVGIGIGSGQISGIIGRILGGSFSDSPQWGRRRTLILSAIISAVASFVLASAQDFFTVVLGNLILGLGIGLYWPSTEAVIADLTVGKQRSEAYAISRLADNIGLQIGIILAGILIATTSAYRLLFVVNAISFVVYAGVIFVGIKETNQSIDKKSSPKKIKLIESWKKALSDKILLSFVAVNILFTLYISQVHTALPLYLNNYVKPQLSPTTISGLFTAHITISVLFQLPVARLLSRWSHPTALMISSSIWGIGFVLIFLMGIARENILVYAILALGILAIAIISYTPAASALVADLAPESLRGTYLAINAQCWAIGYLIGPPLGGWVLDQNSQIVYYYWLFLALSIILGISILYSLNKKMQTDQL